MKQRKTELIIFLMLFFHAFSYCENKNTNDFLAGSAIKSDKWEIDRVNNLEIFQGSVSFRNSLYTLKSEKAIFSHNEKKWQTYGNVYCKRIFEDSSTVESYCDEAVYSQNMETATLFSKKKPVKSVYKLKDNKTFIVLSKKMIAKNSEKKAYFEKDFTVYSDSAVVRGDSGIYDALSGDFDITGLRPYAIGENAAYNIYLEAEKITLNKDNSIIKTFGLSRGTIINKSIGKKEAK